MKRNIYKTNTSKYKRRSVKNIVMNTVVFLVTAFATLSLTSCSRQKQIDYTTEVTEEVVDEIIEPEITDKVSYELIGEDGTIIVNAEINLPENYDKCSVVEYSIVRFTDEDVKNIAQKVFDSDSYFLYMPYSEEEIELLKDRLTSIKDASTDSREKYTLHQELNNLNLVMDNLNPVYQDMEQIEDVKLYTVPAVDAWLPEIEKCCLIGTIEGRYYYLIIAQGADNGSAMMRLQLLRDMNMYGTNGNLGPNSLDVQLYENTCQYSKEDATKLAKEYIQSFGYTDYEVVEVFDCKENAYGPSQETRELNSYNIYFARKIDGYKPCFNASNFPDVVLDSLNYSGAIGKNAPSEYIRVNVDSDGIGEMFVFNPMKEERILESHAKLLPFEDIDSIAKADLQSQLEISYEGMQIQTINITEIDLGYGYTYDMETDRYALIPVWFYVMDENGDNSNFTRRDYISYNALDGSLKDSWGVMVINY